MQQEKLIQKSASQLLYDRALQVMPGGFSRNTVQRLPHPAYVKHAKGCMVMDIEGVERIDFANNMASLIHGHAHPQIVHAVSEQVSKGTAFTLATEAEVLYAEHMCGRNSSFDKVRFVNSGTEAVMSCLKAARAYTEKPKIAKVEGAYHGLYDYAEVSQTANPSNWGEIDNPNSVPVSHGTPMSALQDVVVIPFNDVERSIAILDEHKEELACILVDLIPHRVALQPAAKEFIEALYQWTRKHQTLFVCDEVITFRSAYGGAQELYGITPDLTAMGKMIGGGFPVGALAGRAEVMDVMNPVIGKALFPHSGTFSANPVTMTAGYVSMKMFDAEAVTKLNKLAEYARQQINQAIKLADIPACVAGGGSMFRVHMKESMPLSYRESFATPEQSKALKHLLDYLFDNGVIMINTCSAMLSTVMTEKEIDKLAEVIFKGFKKIKPILES